MLVEHNEVDIMKLFHNYVDVNELPYHSSWDSVIGYIKDHPGHVIIYHTPYGWLFDLFHRFIGGNIGIEDVMNSGDIIKPIVSSYDNDGDCYVIDTIFSNDGVINKSKNVIFIE